jgi:pyrroloquinoline quinone (PQQ) biosynthesis protein C
MLMSTPFGALVLRTDEARRAFDSQPALLEAVAHGMSLPRYRAFLLELYTVVWHFNPVCAVAASRMPDSLRDVRYFLYRHMHEESGHEQWVQADLQAVGVPPEQVQVHEPGPWALALTGYNHWSAAQRHPASVLGMLYALEVVASVYGGTFSAAVRESLLLDGEAGVSFIGSHATLDADHLAELRTVINGIKDASAVDAIVESARLNFHHFGRLFADLPC